MRTLWCILAHWAFHTYRYTVTKRSFHGKVVSTSYRYRCAHCNAKVPFMRRGM
jgi:hypothetical protein